MNDDFWMREALAEAQKCRRCSADFSIEDVPIGAICVFNGQLIGRGHNQRALNNNPVAHAEILALQDAAHTLQSPNLNGVTLYVSLEPCPMCAGALWLSRISRLVFGAWDPKAGACGSIFDLVRDPRLNHRLEVRGGVLETECGTLIRDFFTNCRA